MQSLKKIVSNGLMVLGLLFGLTMSAIAADFVTSKRLAEQGNATQQVYIGDLYRYGAGVRQDYVQALEWYQKAANQGYASGQLRLAYLYYGGVGVRQDYAQALELTRKAANQNYTFAQVQMGHVNEFGIGIRQNKAIAKEWYGMACDNGYYMGCDNYRRLNEQEY